jgi:thiol-disulfide isomerase/thioredoxin
MTPGRRNFLVLGGVAATAAIAGGVTGSLVLQSQSGAADLLSARFPDLAGRPRSLSEWRGRPILCNFWASWCAPCREELPLLDAAHREHAPIGLQIVGIAVDTAANIRQYVKSIPVAYTVLIAEGSALDLIRRLGNRNAALPFTVALDRAGRLRQRKLGAYTAAELKGELAKLLR